MDDRIKLSPKAQQVFKNKATLQELIDCPDSQRLCQLLESSANGDLNTIATKAVKGDGSALLHLIQNVLNTKEGGDLARKLGNRLE